MRRNRQAQGPKPQPAQNNAATCKPDLKKLEADEIRSTTVIGDVISGIESLELSHQPERAVEAAPQRPFDLLPDELVVAILKEVVSSYIEPINKHKAPSRLLRVSKHIHAIATGTPYLWKTIVISGDLRPDRLWLYLRRTTTVDIYVYGRFERETQSLLHQLYVLRALCDSWKSLNVRVSNHKVAATLFSRLDCDPNLETLIIRSNRPASIRAFFVCPKLDTLVIKGAHLDWRRLAINRLRRLEVAFRQLNGEVWSSFEDFLRSNAAQLQHLSIRLENTVQGRPINSLLQLGSLDTLRIADMSGEIVLPLLSSLEVPRLRVLQLSGHGSGWSGWTLEEVLKLVEEEVLKSVEELDLHDLECGEEEMVALVKGLPGLRRVSLRMEGIRPSQVRSIIKLNSERNIAWTVRLAAEDCSINEETSDVDVEAAQQVLEWLATNFEFSIKDFRCDTNSQLPWQHLPARQWRLVDDHEWGKQVWLPPLPISEA